MFTEASQEPCVSAWVLDQIEATPGITSADLRELVPIYMAPRSVAPALTKLTADGAVARHRERTENGGNTFAYTVVDRDAASARITRPFRHLTPGDRPKGVSRNRRRQLPQTDRPEFNFEETNVRETNIKITGEDEVQLPNVDSPSQYGGSGPALDVELPDSVADYMRRARDERPLQTRKLPEPQLKLVATMGDGTEYPIACRHADELRRALGQLYR